MKQDPDADIVFQPLDYIRTRSGSEGTIIRVSEDGKFARAYMSWSRGQSVTIPTHGLRLLARNGTKVPLDSTGKTP